MSLADEYDALVDDGAEGLTQFQAYNALCNIGKNPMGLHFYDFREKHGKTEDDLYTLEELEELNEEVGKEGSPRKILENAFAHFDDEGEGKGFVSKEELQKMLEAVDVYESGLHSDKEMFDMFWKDTLKIGDTDGDGRLSIQELIDLLVAEKVTM